MASFTISTEYDAYAMRLQISLTLKLLQYFTAKTPLKIPNMQNKV